MCQDFLIPNHHLGVFKTNIPLFSYNNIVCSSLYTGEIYQLRKTDGKSQHFKHYIEKIAYT